MVVAVRILQDAGGELVVQRVPPAVNFEGHDGTVLLEGGIAQEALRWKGEHFTGRGAALMNADELPRLCREGFHVGQGAHRTP